MNRQKDKMNKIMKSTLALVIAGTFTFSTTSAFATNDENEQNNTGLTVVAESDATASANVSQSTLAEVTPSIVPGDFLYFAKIALEKIKLALTLDQEKEAELLATYAAERLAEAKVLYDDGEEDKALEMIEESLKKLENAEQIVKDDEEQEDSEAEEEKTEEENENKVESTEDEVADDDSEKDEFSNAEKIISQNIIALKAAIEKVEHKNPVAVAALERNIEKSYQKLAKKLAKIEEKYDDASGEDETVTVDQNVEANSEEKTTDSKAVSETEQTEETTLQEDKEDAVLLIKDIKAEQKANLKEAKQAVKAAEKTAKEEAKQEKKEVKAEQKQQKKQDQDEAKKVKEDKKEKNNAKAEDNQKNK